MKKIRIVKTISLLFFGLIAATQVHAQATRTWVSGVGDDANPCSRTAPCKTFAGAISKTAPSGEINVLDPGGFGALTITKAITIDGSGGSIAGVLVSGTNALVVSAGANDVVTLRNLDIDGLGTGLDGIKFLAGSALHVENCRIYGFTGKGINFVPTAGTANALYVKNTKLLTNTGGGIFIGPTSPATATASLEQVVMEGNLFGLRQGGGASSAVIDSVANRNSGNGFNAVSTDGRTSNLSIDASSASFNTNFGVIAGANANVWIANMQITGNGQGISGGGGAAGNLISFKNNNIAGNSTDGTPNSTVTPL